MAEKGLFGDKHHRPGFGNGLLFPSYLSLDKGTLMLNQNIRYFSGKVNLSAFENSFYGKTLISEGTFEGTVIDITVDFNGQQVRELSYTYYSHGKFVFYALVRIQERTKGPREFWFAFRTDITAVSEASKEEMSIPVTAIEEFNGGYRVEANLVTRHGHFLLAFDRDG